MKRLIAIIVVLLILTAIIGFERIGRGLQFLISDDRTARERTAGETVNLPEGKTRESPRDGQSFSRGVSRPSVPGQGNTDAMRFERAGDAPAIELSIAGGIFPLHFIRASSIVGSTEPSEEQIDRLQQSVAVVAEGLHPGVIVFDADAISTSEAPVLLFARDEFDLTPTVKLVYDTFEKESAQFPETANVEQDGAGQAPTGSESR